MEKEVKEINIKIEKFEKVKEFRDLSTLKLINKDNTTISLNEKFKDFQEIYSLITTNIKTNNKKWIFSEKDEVYYIFSQNRLATSTISTGDRDKNLLEINKISKKFDKISHLFFLYPIKIEFNLPNLDQLHELRNIGFLENGYWYYQYHDNEDIKYDTHSFNSSSTGELSKSIGIFNIESFIENLDIRNQNLKIETNIIKEVDKKIKENAIEIDKYTDLNKFIDILSEIGVFDKTKAEKLVKKNEKKFWWNFLENFNFTTPKKLLDRYKAILLESKELKDFEVILNYNLLDTDIINGEDNQKKFRTLVNLYRTYKNYISCIYIRDNTEDTIELVFNFDKIISSAENRDKLFDGIEILYKDNDLGIEKEKIYNDKNIIYYKNGDIEEIYDPKSESKISMYYFNNKDYEKRTYVNGVLEGESFYKFSNGNSEKREYKNDILQEVTIEKKDEQISQYVYSNENIGEMSVLKKYLSIDRERINIDDYEENRLTDLNLGHWDLKNEDKEELEKILGKNVYERNPKKDINDGVVGIDFGTKSTVVVYQKNRTTIMPMRISGGIILNNDIRDEDYENPTVIEFIDKVNFLKDYNARQGRPETKWKDITVSYTAFSNLSKGNGEQFHSIISDIKQWTVRNEELYLKDRKGNEFTLPTYSKLDENKDKENFLDPVELYAYYIGSYINTMKNGIYLEYYLSFPVTYEKSIREKILNSFKRGIKKSLPIEIQADEKIMKRFKVERGANESAAYAICALKTFKIEPKDEEDKIYYGVFDFGGGTTDFDFGIWKLGKEEEGYDYDLEHFGAGGDINLGGENIIKELAYRIFTNNSSKLRERRMEYTRPSNYPELLGEESLVRNDSTIAKLNTKLLAEELRKIWENVEKNNRERIDVIKLTFYNTHNESIRGLELNVNEDELNNLIKERIETGVKNFFIKLEDAFKDEGAKEINIFLGGNSCKHPFVNEIFKRYQEELKDKYILNIYDVKAIKDINKDSKKVSPTAKTGVAYGLIYSRKGGKIKVTNRDEKTNIGNEINFKYYIGNSKRDKFVPVITPNSKYEEYSFFGIVTSNIFEVYYTTSPEALTKQMELEKSIVKRIALKNEYNEGEKYRIYIKANMNQPTVIHYVMVNNEEDIETKEFLEEADINLE